MLFQNASIFTPEGQFLHGSFCVENGRFREIRFSPDRTAGSESSGSKPLIAQKGGAAREAASGESVVDLQGALVLPGLIDLHVHGSLGADFSDGDPDGLVRMAKYLARNGVTSFAPASMTLPVEVLKKAFETGARYAASFPSLSGCARLLGIHMEGPYLAAAARGAQNEAHLRLPDFEEFEKLYQASEGLIRIVDVAPELPGAAKFARKASALCTVSCAHTRAVYEEAATFFESGATHLTHLFNAMPPIHHRAPGVIGAAAERPNVTAELICDGVHVHPSAVRMAFRLFPERICLVSDALRCLGMKEGEYELGGQTVFLKENAAYLADGTLAGSASSLFACLQNAVYFGVPLKEAVFAATRNPAAVLGRFGELGSIEEGKLADFLVCTEGLELSAVYLEGRRVDHSASDR